jgi:hypothetical protein
MTTKQDEFHKFSESSRALIRLWTKERRSLCREFRDVSNEKTFLLDRFEVHIEALKPGLVEKFKERSFGYQDTLKRFENKNLLDIGQKQWAQWKSNLPKPMNKNERRAQYTSRAERDLFSIWFMESICAGKMTFLP